MTSSEIPPEPPPLPAKRQVWQFSLRTVMIVMTAVAGLLGLSSVLPFLSGMLLGGLWLVLSGWLLVGIVFGSGDDRAFCIGAGIVVASTWTGMGGQFLESSQRLAYDLGATGVWPGSGAAWFKHLVLLVAGVGNGWLCIQARRFFELRH